MYNFNQFINEAKKLSRKEITDKFGKILFGEFRRKNEPDTEYEEEVFDNLKLFIKGDLTGKNLDKEFLDNLEELQQLKNQFPDVLKPVEAEYFYRGVTVGRSGGRKLVDFVDYDDPFEITNLRYNEDEIADDPMLETEYMIRCKKPINYKSRSSVQSWTHRLDIATIFGNLILESDLEPRNLLFDFQFLNKVDSKVDLDDPEYETMRISDKPVKSYILIPDGSYVSFMVEGILNKFISIDDVLNEYQDEVQRLLK